MQIRRHTENGSPLNSNHWTQSEHQNINELRKEIFADLPGIFRQSKTHESKHNQHSSASDVSANLDNLVNVVNAEGAAADGDARDSLALYNFMSKQPPRNTYDEEDDVDEGVADELDKRNGFFFGKRNGFFFGKRAAIESDSVRPLKLR